MFRPLLVHALKLGKALSPPRKTIKKVTHKISAHSTHMRTKVLVFPATHLDGVSFIESARDQGRAVVAATSEMDIVFQELLGPMVQLPYIYDQSFPDALLNLLEKEGIDEIFCPVSSVYTWLKNFIDSSRLNLTLMGDSPQARAMAAHHKLMANVDRHYSFIEVCAGGRLELSKIELAAIFRVASGIYGESNETKIAAMIGVFEHVPKGDVVEIGSLAGKSAAVLTLLARRHRTGNVLAVDAWQSDASRQHDSPDIVRVHMPDSWDLNVLLKMFCVNTFPIGVGVFNYMHSESVPASVAYKRDGFVENDMFGRIDYTGRISLIHIDANHDYAKVKLDCEAWLPLLVPGGWLILDDYLWAHGDGPKRIGDEILKDRQHEIRCAFVCGKALFVQFNEKFSY